MKTKTIIKWLSIPLIILIILLVVPFPVLAQSNGISVKIGVLVKRSPKICMEKWVPTAQYLTSEIPGYSFKVVPLDFEEVFLAVEHGEVDFVLANSSFYVEMEVKYGAERIATLNNLREGGAYTIFGGVIFCLGDRTDIQDISDLKGKSFMAVHETSLGGWHMAWRELKTEGIDPYHDFTGLRFGGTHDAVVYAVRDDKVDAGTVRTDTLERMAAEGKIDLETFHIINSQETEGFPYMHSTRLYPEWPFAKAKHTSNELALKVAIALLSMPPDSQAAKAGKLAGWTTPLNYQPVHECLRELRICPYTEFGKVTLADLIKQYLYWIIVIGVLLILMIAASLCLLRLNHRLRQSQSALEKELSERRQAEEALQKAHDELEQRVEERTEELLKANEQLKNEIEERKQAEEDRKKLESQLQQSQKLEAIGSLAGGVAHDFNNILTIIIGNAELLSISLGEDDPLQGRVEEISKGGERAASLTRQLLAFSRRQVLQPQVLDLNGVIPNMDKMLRRLIGEDIDLETVLAPDLGRVEADPGQIEQVIMNLAVNARDAMPTGGKLTIETANVDLDESYARKHVAVKPGPYVMMAISDTGTGMDKETRSRIFEPFFTTKKKGRGTGLGLSTVYGIVKQSGGNIWVYSEPEKGTTFKIYLPRVEKVAETAEKVKATAESLTGSETIMVVEDDDMVRDMARSILQRYGYSILDAPDGEEAIRVSEQYEGPIHLMLTDVVMPGISGRVLAERLAVQRPKMKVLYMSGYTDNAIVRHGVLDKEVILIQKPFTVEALAQKVREVLDK